MNTTSQIVEMPIYYDRYINYVDKKMDIVDALQHYDISYVSKSADLYNLLGDRTYQPEKWTTKQIFLHIIDTERIFNYRALRFARKDKTPLPGFDENQFALHANSEKRTLGDIWEEWDSVRKSTIQMFKHFDEDDLQQSGIMSNTQISVLALGFTTVGHLIHHIRVIEDRYFTLINQ